MTVIARGYPPETPYEQINDWLSTPLIGWGWPDPLWWFTGGTLLVALATLAAVLVILRWEPKR